MCMLKGSRLPNGWRAEALVTAKYLRNISPTSSLEEMTLYERMKGIKPDLSLLRMFGCLAYLRIPPINRDRKLGDKSKDGIMIGYAKGQNRYQIMDRKTHQISVARDVKFDETSFHYQMREEEPQLSGVGELVGEVGT